MSKLPGFKTRAQGFQVDGYKYPWSKWCDGKVWQAVQYKDFDSTVNGFKGTLNNHAKRYGASVVVRCDYKLGTVSFRFLSCESTNSYDSNLVYEIRKVHRRYVAKMEALREQHNMTESEFADFVIATLEKRQSK